MRELERLFPHELVVVGVHSPKFPAERDPANLRAALQRLGVSHPVVADPDLALWGQYAVRAWPTAIFLDPGGLVVAKHEGEFALPAVRDLVASLVARAEAAGVLDPDPLPADPLPPGGGALRFPGKVLVDPAGDRLFLADSGHHRILVCAPDGRIVHAYGDGEPGLVDGPAAAARFRHPQGMALDRAAGRLFVADEENHAVRAVDLASGRVTTVAGTGEQGYDRRGGDARAAALSSPTDLALVADRLWIAMAGTHQLWTLDLLGARVAVAAGSGAEALHDGPLDQAAFAQPSGLAADPRSGQLFVADAESSAIRRVDPAAGRVRRLVGRGLFAFGDLDGTGDEARLQHPLAVAVDPAGPNPGVYVADTYNDKIKRLDPATRRLDTLAGGPPGHEDGPLAAVRFRQPSGLARSGHRLYVADTDNHALRRVDLDTATVHTLDVRE